MLSPGFCTFITLTVPGYFRFLVFSRIVEGLAIGAGRFRKTVFLVVLVLSSMFDDKLPLSVGVVLNFPTSFVLVNDSEDA